MGVFFCECVVDECTDHFWVAAVFFDDVVDAWFFFWEEYGAVNDSVREVFVVRARVHHLLECGCGLYACELLYELVVDCFHGVGPGCVSEVVAECCELDVFFVKFFFL